MILREVSCKQFWVLPFDFGEGFIIILVVEDILMQGAFLGSLNEGVE